MAAQQKSPQEWAKQIASAGLPALGNTLNQVSAINEFMISHAAELTRVVLRDPGMTAKVIRLANTVHFNPTQRRVSTISRAVIVLGFKTIRSLCVASLLLDELLAKANSEPLRRELAESFNSAMQAREIAQARGEKNVEEIFIAGLLAHVGELSFWAIGGEAADQIAQALKRGVTTEQAEEQILGFRLQRLTGELAREWKLNDSLSGLLGSEATGNDARCVQLGAALGHNRDRAMQGEAAQNLMQEVAQFTGQSMDSVLAQNEAAQAHTGDMLRACGMAELMQFVTVDMQAETAEEIDIPSGEADPGLQLAVVRELALMALSKVDINLVLQLVLEAIHRGAGINRVCVALLNQPRTHLVAKYALEWPASGLQGKFQMELWRSACLQQVINTGAILWSWRDGDRHSFVQLLKITGGSDAVIGPLTVNGKIIGAFYADRMNDALSSADVEAFELFVLQSRMCLQWLSK